MSGCFSQKYYKVQRLYFNMIWITETDWVMSILDAERWIREINNPIEITTKK